MKAILAKLHAIMKEVDFIAKDKTNDFHKYNYASEQAIKETLHKLLVDHGVLFILSSSNIRHTGTLTDIDCIYKFYDVESGEYLEGTFIGTGEDKLDKGTYKAITGALKYILTSTFLIPTGDDPEKTSSQSKPDPKPTYIQKKLPITLGGAVQVCKCGGTYSVKNGQYGQFLSCSNYPKCKIKAPQIPKPKLSQAVSAEEIETMYGVPPEEPYLN